MTTVWIADPDERSALEAQELLQTEHNIRVFLDVDHLLESIHTPGPEPPDILLFAREFINYKWPEVRDLEEIYGTILVGAGPSIFSDSWIDSLLKLGAMLVIFKPYPENRLPNRIRDCLATKLNPQK